MFIIKMLMRKICPKCKIEKQHSDYHKDLRKNGGIRNRCKACCKAETNSWREKNKAHYNNYTAMWRSKNPDKQHATEIKRLYGLSIEKYNEMLLAQDLKCKICGKQHDSSRKRGRLYVDHCHDSNQIRGLLCGACNSAIGYFNHNIEIIKKSILYLQS